MEHFTEYWDKLLHEIKSDEDRVRQNRTNYDVK